MKTEAVSFKNGGYTVKSEMDYLPKGNEDPFLVFKLFYPFLASEMDYLPKGNEDK